MGDDYCEEKRPWTSAGTYFVDVARCASSAATWVRPAFAALTR